jgi:chemotaxis methyl-accepting protein methylase
MRMRYDKARKGWGQGLTADEYRLSRGHVVFRVGNLVDMWSFAGISNQDVVFCRNILSHMSSEGIQRAVRNIHSVLSDAGCLIIGSSESLFRTPNLFAPHYTDGMVLCRKNTGTALKRDELPGRYNLQERVG